MLRQRVLTALVLIPLVVGAIFALPTVAVAALFALLVLAGGWEWTRLVPFATTGRRVLYLVIVALTLALLWQLRFESDIVLALLALAALWWVGATVWVIRYRGAGGEQRPLKAFAGLATLAPAWLALAVLHGDPALGPWLLLYVMVLMWVADSGAYFAGRAFGRHKLAPRVSPGKTWEGVAGAVAATLLYAGIAGPFLGFAGGRLAGFMALSVVAMGVSIVGDLFESLLKRDQGLKDSGSLLPGHGGVLDRVDSLTAGAPIALLGLLLERAA